jgi:hypothetical protein
VIKRLKDFVWPPLSSVTIIKVLKRYRGVEGFFEDRNLCLDWICIDWKFRQ